MNNAVEICSFSIEPWQISHYAALSKRAKFSTTAAWVARLDGHRKILRAEGDMVAVEGLSEPIRQSVLDLAAIRPSTARTLSRKVKVLAEYRSDWASNPMTRMMIEAAVAADVTALGVSAAEAERLRRRLNGERLAEV